MPLRADEACDMSVLFERPAKDANEAQLLHERIDAGLEDLGTDGPSGLGSSVTSSPFFLAVRTMSAGERQHTARASSNSLTPTSVLPEQHKDGHQRTFGDGADDQARQFFVGRLCPFEVAFHHLFVDLDDRLDQRLADLVDVQ